MKKSFCSVLVPAGLGALCAACNAPATDAPLAARVNGTEITIRQVAAASPGDARGNPRQALERIIDRELLVQQALASGLEREPHVVQTIDNARRQLLAQAWLEHAALEAAKSTPAEVSAFYGDNPALFAERRVYRLREISIPAPVERVDLLRDMAEHAREFEEVQEWLRAHGVKFSVATMTQPAEQLPLRYLPRLAVMKEGDIGWFSSPLGGSVIQVVQARPMPLSQAQAAPLIERFLSGRKRLELAAAEVKRLRSVASIQYLGEFTPP